MPCRAMPYRAMPYRAMPWGGKLLPETPWDAGGVGPGGAGTVLFDPADGLYKVWYLAEPALSQETYNPHGVGCARYVMLSVTPVPSAHRTTTPLT